MQVPPIFLFCFVFLLETPKSVHRHTLTTVSRHCVKSSPGMHIASASDLHEISTFIHAFNATNPTFGRIGYQLCGPVTAMGGQMPLHSPALSDARRKCQRQEDLYARDPPS